MTDTISDEKYNIGNYLTKEQIECIKKEAYAKGKADGIEEYQQKYPKTDTEKNIQIMSWETGFSEGYAKGQTNLHSRLIDRISSWGIESSNREAPVLRRVMEIIDEEASESATQKNDTTCMTDGEKAEKEASLRESPSASAPEIQKNCGSSVPPRSAERGGAPNRTMCHCRADAFLSDDGESYNCAGCGQFTENCKCDKPKEPPIKKCDIEGCEGCRTYKPEKSKATKKLKPCWKHNTYYCQKCKSEKPCNHEWGDGHTPDGKIHWENCVKCDTPNRNGKSKR